MQQLDHSLHIIIAYLAYGGRPQSARYSDISVDGASDAMLCRMLREHAAMRLRFLQYDVDDGDQVDPLGQ